MFWPIRGVLSVYGAFTISQERACVSRETLFADTEGTEDRAEQVLDIDTPRHTGKFGCGLSHIFGNKLKAPAIFQHRRPQMGQGIFERHAMAFPHDNSILSKLVSLTNQILQG